MEINDNLSEDEKNDNHSEEAKNSENKALTIIDKQDCEDVPEELNELLEHLDIPEEKRTNIRAIVQEYSFRGPIPPPHIIRGYAEVYPDAPEIIFSMAKGNSEHRITTTEKLVDADIRQSDRGLIFAFILAMSFLIGGLILVGLGKDLTGYFVIIADILTLISYFIKDKFFDSSQKSKTKSKEIESSDD